MKRYLSLICAFALLLSSLALSVQSFAADNIFDDDAVITDLPEFSDGVKADPIEQMGDFYDVIEDSISPQPQTSEIGQNTTDNNNGSLETAETNQQKIDEIVTGNIDKTEEVVKASNTAAEIPDDAFDGKFAEFPGEDGSVTKVYDNGSVVTTYSDGTKEGITYTGNRVTEDSEGNQTHYYNDGTSITYGADGSLSSELQDGTKIYFNDDGSSKVLSPTGYWSDVDASGKTLAVYYENGERLELHDKDGNLIEGERSITGPNGKKYTIAWITDENGNLTKGSTASEGNGLEQHYTIEINHGSSATLNVSTLDGSTANIAINLDNSTDEPSDIIKIDLVNGNGIDETHIARSETAFSMTTKDKSGTSSMSSCWTDENGGKLEMKMSDGRTMEYTVDKDGNTVSGTITAKDGSYIKTDKENGSEISNAETGWYFKNDKNGNLVSVRMPLSNGASYDFKDGTGILIDNENGNKVVWTHDEDGNLVIESPNGKYTADSEGNLYKDGKPVRYGGNWVNVKSGLNTDESTETTSVETTTQEVTEEGLPALKLEGSYNVTGTVTWTDEEGSESESVSGTISVGVIDETTLSFDDGIADYKSSYDPKTGKASGFTDDSGAHCSFTFTESNGTIIITMNYSYSDGSESGIGSVSGTKQ